MPLNRFEDINRFFYVFNLPRNVFVFNKVYIKYFDSYDICTDFEVDGIFGVIFTVFIFTVLNSWSICRR